jgi:hypothetical protein
MTFLQTLLSFLAALTLLIFVHEMGITWWRGGAASRCCADRLRPAAGALTVGADRTEWTLSAIPLGGYALLDEREQATETIPPQDLPRAFTRQPLSKRALIVAAGPAANFCWPSCCTPCSTRSALRSLPPGWMRRRSVALLPWPAFALATSWWLPTAARSALERTSAAADRRVIERRRAAGDRA